jgi:uncharacterized membrane protein YphA (DoxX/SURF4 family)
MSRLLCSTWLAARLEVVLGVIFVYAAYFKIAEPPDFAHMIYNYKLTPGQLINLLAIYLPWVEMVAGAALILGLPGRRGAVALVGAMLVVFVAAISINLARGHAIDCGCFGLPAGPPKSRAELLSDMWWVVARDLGMLILVTQVLLARPSRGPARQPLSPAERPVEAPAA